MWDTSIAMRVRCWTRAHNRQRPQKRETACQRVEAVLQEPDADPGTVRKQHQQVLRPDDACIEATMSALHDLRKNNMSHQWA